MSAARLRQERVEQDWCRWGWWVLAFQLAVFCFIPATLWVLDAKAGTHHTFAWVMVPSARRSLASKAPGQRQKEQSNQSRAIGRSAPARHFCRKPQSVPN